MIQTKGKIIILCLGILSTYMANAQINAFLPKGSCGNPYVISDSMTQISIAETHTDKVWFTFVSQQNNFYINFSTEDNRIYNYLVFKYTGMAFCDSINQKKLIPERNKVCDLEIETDALSILSYENINRGLCACGRCCSSQTIFKGRAGERYMAVVYFPENSIKAHLSADLSPYSVPLALNNADGEIPEIANLEVGATIVLENIYFRPGTNDILAQSFPSLNKLYEFLHANPSVIIEIQGHVNAPNERPDINHSGNLAGRRARAVYDYLTTRGIHGDRMSYKGLGNTQMIYPSTTTEREMAKNRRVEIVILSK